MLLYLSPTDWIILYENKDIRNLFFVRLHQRKMRNRQGFAACTLSLHNARVAGKKKMRKLHYSHFSSRKSCESLMTQSLGVHITAKALMNVHEKAEWNWVIDLKNDYFYGLMNGTVNVNAGSIIHSKLAILTSWRFLTDVLFFITKMLNFI